MASTNQDRTKLHHLVRKLRRPELVISEVSTEDLVLRLALFSAHFGTGDIDKRVLKDALVRIDRFEERLFEWAILAAEGKENRPRKGGYVFRVFPINLIKNLTWYLIHANHNLEYVKSLPYPSTRKKRSELVDLKRTTKDCIRSFESQILDALLHYSDKKRFKTAFLTCDQAYEIFADLTSSILGKRKAASIGRSSRRNEKVFVSFRKVNGKIRVIETKIHGRAKGTYPNRRKQPLSRAKLSGIRS